MSPLVLAITLLASPTPSGSWSPELGARCLWAERGWQSAVLDLSNADDADATERVREELAEHARLHGWIGEAGDGLSWMVLEPAGCPPVALVELRGVPREGLSGARSAAFRALARALAENGNVEAAVELLDEIGNRAALAPHAARPLGYRDAASWDAARLLAQAGRWELALARLDRLHADGRWSPQAVDRERARALRALGRLPELEAHVFESLTSDGSCESLEHLVAAWREHAPKKGLAELVAGVTRGVNDPTARRRLENEVAERWDRARRHLHVLGMAPRYALAELAELLRGEDHRREALAILASVGPQGIDYLLELASSLPPHELELFDGIYSLLAETGLPELEPVVEAVSELSPSFPYLEIWNVANRLREDLERVGPR